MLHVTLTTIARSVASGVLLAMLAACAPEGESTPPDAPPTGGSTQPANRAPTIGGDGGAAIVVGTPYSFTPTAADPEGNSLAFAITGKPAWLAFDTSTGALSGTPSASDAGVFNLTITASDGSLSASLSFAVTVNPAPAPPPPASNTAPVISGSGAASINVGQTYSFTPTASDRDGNPLVFSITGKPAWATFNSMNGALAGTANAAGSSNVTITVSDGTASAAIAFTITVVQPNRAPSLSGTGAATVNVGSPYAFTPAASDPDGNRLTFSISGKPSWASFNTSTGALSGTPGSGNVGTSNVTITVSDGTLSASISFAITVVQPNRAPTISGNGTRTVSVGTAYEFTPTASDPDGDKLIYSVTGKPAWLTFSTTTGALTGTPAAADVGSYAMRITVSDATQSANLDVTVTVAASGTGSATLSWTAPTQRTDGTALSGLSGYRIYYGTSSAALTSRADVTNPSLTTYVVEGLTAGTWYFAATAVDSSGIESSRTSTVSLTVN